MARFIDENQLKRIVYARKSLPVTEIVIVKHPKQIQGWFAVHEKSKKAYEVFVEIEEVEEVPIWKVPGFSKYDPSK